MRSLLSCGLAFWVASSVWAQPQPKPIKRPKNNELKIEGSQSPQAAAETPVAIVANADRLVVSVSALQNNGLLSEQVREALKALIKNNAGATIVKLRAYVAGTGDLRRVPAIVAEMFGEKKLALPVVTVVRVGSLGADKAQVVIESIAETKRAAASGGVVFVSGPVSAMGLQAVESLLKALPASGVTASDTLHVSCFVDSADQIEGTHSALVRAFGRASSVVVESNRVSTSSAANCDAMARSTTVATGKVVFSAAQMVFGEQDSDVKLSLDRLKKNIDVAGGNTDRLLFATIYALSQEAAAEVMGVVKAPNPSTTEMRLVEALPSEDAVAAIEVVAAAR